MPLQLPEGYIPVLNLETGRRQAIHTNDLLMNASQFRRLTPQEISGREPPSPSPGFEAQHERAVEQGLPVESAPFQAAAQREVLQGPLLSNRPVPSDSSELIHRGFEAIGAGTPAGYATWLASGGMGRAGGGAYAGIKSVVENALRGASGGVRGGGVWAPFSAARRGLGSLAGTAADVGTEAGLGAAVGAGAAGITGGDISEGAGQGARIGTILGGAQRVLTPPMEITARAARFLAQRFPNVPGLSSLGETAGTWLSQQRRVAERETPEVFSGQARPPDAMYEQGYVRQQERAAAKQAHDQAMERTLGSMNEQAVAKQQAEAASMNQAIEHQRREQLAFSAAQEEQAKRAATSQVAQRTAEETRAEEINKSVIQYRKQQQAHAEAAKEHAELNTAQAKAREDAFQVQQEAKAVKIGEGMTYLGSTKVFGRPITNLDSFHRMVGRDEGRLIAKDEFTASMDAIAKRTPDVTITDETGKRIAIPAVNAFDMLTGIGGQRRIGKAVEANLDYGKMRSEIRSQLAAEDLPMFNEAQATMAKRMGLRHLYALHPEIIQTGKSMMESPRFDPVAFRKALYNPKTIKEVERRTGQDNYEELMQAVAPRILP